MKHWLVALLVAALIFVLGLLLVGLRYSESRTKIES